jgi:hypothetical protein
MLNLSFDSVDYRIEMVTEEEIEKRNEYSILVLTEVDELEGRWATFGLNEGTELVTLILELISLQYTVDAFTLSALRVS